MSKEWFQSSWSSVSRPSFEKWWLEFYGPPEDYRDEDEYWVRKGFALAGWTGRERDR